MAVASTLVIWCGGTPASYRASLRYLMIHLLGGVLLFAGITGHVAGGGGLALAALTLESPAHWFILAGVVINAGAPPLAAWIPDAYPEASWSGSVFLSSFTTKAAVLVLLRSFAGQEVLVWAGLFMALHGIAMALLASDLRRILAYSIINQVGLMVVGIGIGSEMALNGAAAHAIASLLYTALLFMSTGAVLRATGQRDVFALGGLLRRMPLASIAAAIGALSLSALPLTAGFVTKSMTMQAAADAHLQPVWLLMVAASAGAFVYMGLRTLWLAYFRPAADAVVPATTPQSMQLAMFVLAALCIALGVWPQALYAWLPYPTDYQPYTGAHLVAQAQLLLFAALAFAWLRPNLQPSQRTVLDFDWLWRRLLPRLVQHAAALIGALLTQWRQARTSAGRLALAAVLRHHGEQGSIARTWPTGSMAMWVLVLLLGYLLLYYI
jgi:multicomponent Na+:H+ antiporter subunit D